MVSSQPRGLDPRNLSKHANARKQASCTTSSASCGFLMSHRARFTAAGRCGPSAPSNPRAFVERITLPPRNPLLQAGQAGNALPVQPGFIVFTGDLTHTTDDDGLRRKRMAGFRQIVAGLKTQSHRYMPGEHDASLDEGKAFQEHFGAMHYSFDHKRIHFVVLDNVSDPAAKLGDAQLDWLLRDLKPLAPTAPIVVFTHRPLFDLAPTWDWTTKDGGKAIDLLQHWQNVTVFYGHIHQ